METPTRLTHGCTKAFGVAVVILLDVGRVGVLAAMRQKLRSVMRCVRHA
jgi:hypothetical protein